MHFDLTNYINDFSKFILLFNNWPGLITLLSLGLLWRKTRIGFISIIRLLLLSLLINSALKLTFKIPLNPALLKNWYSWPSGHLQTGTVVYGHLAFLTGSPFAIVLAIVFLGIVAACTIWSGFHNPIDAISGIFI